MKQIIITIILAVMALPLVAANANLDRAHQAYKQELYNEALKLYLQEAEQTGVSSALYCNIGDTYYITSVPCCLIRPMVTRASTWSLCVARCSCPMMLATHGSATGLIRR